MDEGSRLSGDGADEPVLTDGPYAESKEHIGGFWVIDAPDLDVALRLGRSPEARTAYDRAIDLVGNTAEVAYLTRRRDQARPLRRHR